MNVEGSTTETRERDFFGYLDEEPVYLVEDELFLAVVEERLKDFIPKIDFVCPECGVAMKHNDPLCGNCWEVYKERVREWRYHGGSTCPDCGKDISGSWHTTLRCKECVVVFNKINSRIMRRASRRKQRELL